MAPVQLTATYASPGDQRTFSLGMPAAQAGDVKGKTEYLAALRSNITHVQSDVNAFLTKKMEDDKPSGDKRADQDDKAEAMYGEEERYTTQHMVKPALSTQLLQLETTLKFSLLLRPALRGQECTYHSRVSNAFGEGGIVGRAAEEVDYSGRKAVIVKVSSEVMYTELGTYVIEEKHKIGEGFWFDELRAKQ